MRAYENVLAFACPYVERVCSTIQVTPSVQPSAGKLRSLSAGIAVDIVMWE